MLSQGVQHPNVATDLIANAATREYALASLTPFPYQIPKSREAGPISADAGSIYSEEAHPMSAANKAVVRRLYEEVWSRRRVDVIKEIISPSHALHDANVTGSSVGPEAYKRQFLSFIAGFPDLRFSIEDVVAEESKVVVSWNISGTHKGEFLGVAATNKKVSVDGITINHIANGKIMDSYISWDALSLLQQLGAIPASSPRKTATAR